jgi:polysaccharide export outer membrane protein
MRTLYPIVLFTALFLCLFLLTDCGSTRMVPEEETLGTPREAVPEPSQPTRAPPIIYGPEDLFRIEVWRMEDMTREVRADRDGTISLPLVGSVNVAGQNKNWLVWELTERYRKYYNDPDVLVELLDSPNQKAYVLGEVNNPGAYKITGTTSVLQAISMAGGFTDDVDLDAVVLVRGDIAVPRVIPLNLRDAIEKGDLTQDWYLLRGDIVYVNKTKIADLELFARRLATILSPVVQLERALILGAIVPDAVLHGNVATRVTID